MKRVLLFLMAVVLLAGCTQKVSFTEVMISDPVRHYYPILQGQQLRIVARVTNIGNVPLVIRDIQRERKTGSDCAARPVHVSDPGL